MHRIHRFFTEMMEIEKNRRDELNKEEGAKGMKKKIKKKVLTQWSTRQGKEEKKDSTMISGRNSVKTLMKKKC